MDLTQVIKALARSAAMRRRMDVLGNVFFDKASEKVADNWGGLISTKIIDKDF